ERHDAGPCRGRARSAGRRPVTRGRRARTRCLPRHPVPPPRHDHGWGCLMSDSGSVFGPGPRHDASPASHRESSAQFLERVAGDYWQAVRDLLDDWLGRVPPPERRDLMGRLRRAEDHTFRAAFLELYLHESLVQSGFDVEFHPEVPGVRRRPDFLALSTSSTFYLEARSPSTATNKRASAGRVGDVHDALNRVDSPNFWLWIDVEAEGGRPLATKGLRAQLEGSLAGLDPDSETSQIGRAAG